METYTVESRRLDGRQPHACVATEIDFDSTVVAASEECAAALLADDRLEALAVQPEDRLAIGGDVLND